MLRTPLAKCHTVLVKAEPQYYRRWQIGTAVLMLFAALSISILNLAAESFILAAIPHIMVICIMMLRFFLNVLANETFDASPIYTLYLPAAVKSKRFVAISNMTNRVYYSMVMFVSYLLITATFLLPVVLISSYVSR